MIKLDQAVDQGGSAETGMMPMVDVIFTLIAFMMLIINAPQIAMDLDLPVASEQVQPLDSEKTMTLTVVSDKPQWRLDSGEALDKQGILLELQAKMDLSNGKLVTLLEVDKQAPAQRVVDTLEILGQLGIKDARILLEPAQ